MIELLPNLTDDSLTYFVRQVPNRADFRLTSQVLPPEAIDSPKYRVANVDVTVEAAKYRVHNAPAPYSNIDATRSVTEGYFPPLGGKEPVEEFEMLLQPIINGANQNALEAAAFDKAKTQTDAIWARLELAAGSLLATRKVEISENGVIQSIAFDKVAGKTIADDVTGAWSGSTAKPLTDEQNWVRAARTVYGAPAPGLVLASSEIIAKLCASKEYVAQLYSGSGAPTAISPTQLNQVRLQWGLAPIEAYDAQVKVDGEYVRTLPADRLIILPSPAAESVGRTQFGTTAEAMVMATGSNPGIVASEAPGIVSTKLVEQDPPRVLTRTVAAALPVLTAPGHYVTAKIS